MKQFNKSQTVTTINKEVEKKKNNKCFTQRWLLKCNDQLWNLGGEVCRWNESSQLIIKVTLNRPLYNFHIFYSKVHTSIIKSQWQTIYSSYKKAKNSTVHCYLNQQFWLLPASGQILSCHLKKTKNHEAYQKDEQKIIEQMHFSRSSELPCKRNYFLQQESPSWHK